MKMEIAKEDGRYIDSKKDLNIINKMRNLIHYLMKGIDLDDYENYVCANEILTDAENNIWKVIIDDDEEQEETLRDEITIIVDRFRTILFRYKERYNQDEKILVLINEFDEVKECLYSIIKK